MRYGTAAQVQFGLQLQGRLAASITSSTTAKPRLHAVRQRNGGTIQHRDVGKSFQDRCQRLRGADNHLGSLTKQLFQERGQLRGEPLIDRLRADIGTALGRDTSQVFIGGVGILQEPKNKRPRQRQSSKLPSPHDDATGLCGLLRNGPQQLLQRHANLGYNLHGKLLLPNHAC